MPPPARPAAALSPAPPPRGAQALAPWAVLALSLLLTGLFTHWGLQEASRRRQARFEAAVQGVVERLEVRLESHVGLLRGATGLFLGSSEVTRAEFSAYVEQLLLPERFPGVHGVGFTPRVREGEEAALVAWARAQGFADFHIWPERVPGRERFTILYLEPLEARNRAALGYDMASEPVRQAAMQRACDTGAPALSGKVELKQEIDSRKQPGFLLYLPLYVGGGLPLTLPQRRERLRGYVYAPFRAGDFFERLFSEEARSPVAFQVYDGVAARPDALLYASAPGEPAEGPYAQVRTLTLAGRPWTLVFHARPGYVSFGERVVRPALGVLGVLVSLALFALTRGRGRELARTRALHESEERFRALALHSASLLWRADATGTRFSAPGWQAFTGQSEEQMNAGGWSQVVHEEDRATVSAAWAGAREARAPLQLTFRMKMPGGGLRWVLNRAVPLLDAEGRVREWVGSLTDVTEQRLREDEVRRRTEFEQQLIGIVSHDLRTPLSAIGMSAASLLGAPGLDARQQRGLTRIASSAARANRLIETLLDFTRARLGSGIPVTPRPVDLAALARRAVDEAQAAHPERPLLLSCEGDLQGEWDPERLEQLLGNLLGNAVRHGEPDSPVRVHVEGRAEGLREALGEALGEELGNAQQWVRLSVHNTGEPIPPAQLPTLFEPFRVGGPEAAARGGLGLGLYIVKEIVRSHGGRVEVRSSSDEGTTFRVLLPRRPLSAPAAAAR